MDGGEREDDAGCWVLGTFVGAATWASVQQDSLPRVSRVSH